MLGLLSDLIDVLQEKFPPNRLVVLATPLLAAASGYVATWSAQNIAFLNLTEGQLTAVFIAGAAAVIPAVYKWLDGWQKHEARQAKEPPTVASVVVDSVKAILDQPPTAPPYDPTDIPPDVDAARTGAAEAETRRKGIPPA